MLATIRATFRIQWEHWMRRAESRLPALTRYRVAEPLPIRLHQRRIYVVPAGFGFFFGVVLVTMLLGALNFNDNAALMLTFALTGVVLISLPRTVRHLDQLALVAVHAEPVFAGEPLVASFRFTPADARERARLRLRVDGVDRVFDLAEGGSTLAVTLQTQRRGWLPVGRSALWTDYPLGVFHAWSVLNPDQRLLVYPRPETAGPGLPPGGQLGEGRLAKPEGEDWQGLRDYRSGDAPRRVAGKASAREERLLVKEFADPIAGEVTLDWNALGAIDYEDRISRLARWVLVAEDEQRPYRLRLPSVELGPALGPAHQANCLRELALMP
jgi:uncharacterized protein (DUF58 family)